MAAAPSPGGLRRAEACVVTGAWVLLALTDAHVLTLAEAVATAEAHQPRLHGARADVDAMRAQADEVRAPLLPQVRATASYERTTANRVWRRLGSPTASYLVPTTWDAIGLFDFGLAASQVVWDFGQTANTWRSARARAEAQVDSARLVHLEVVMAVHAAFFAARAQKALADVAREALLNQQRHLEQIAGFVEVGTRPEIDLAHARADLGSARVRMIEAGNGYQVAKARLNQAMGVVGPTDYDLADETLAPIEGEDGPLDGLADEAATAHAGLAALRGQLRAYELTARSIRGAYGPTLSVGGTLTDAGSEVDHLRWNAGGVVTMTWPLFQGMLTSARSREVDARVAALRAEAEALSQQVRLGVTELALDLRAARESLAAASDAVASAHERLRLAEARYETGAGGIIELADAQLAEIAAAGQRIQAEYTLSASRAQLQAVLGRMAAPSATPPRSQERRE